MTAAGRLRSALRDEIHGVTAQSDEQNLEIIRISRLSLPPTNTCGRKAGLGYTLEGRDPYVDGPRLARTLAVRLGLVGCGHMSGLCDAVG